MSDKIPKSVFASLPRTTRGSPIVLGGDPKGKNFLYTNNNSVIIRDISDPGVADVYTQHSCNAISAKYSPSGFYIASGDVSGKIRIWDTVNREHILKNEFQPLGGTIKDIGWSGDSQRIAVCGEGREKFAHVFSMDTGTSVGDLIGIGKACNSISFKEQRPFKIVVGCEDKSASFFEGPPFKFKLSLTEHTNFVNVVRFSPDGSIFITGGADGKALIYDGKTAESIGNLGDPAHKGGIYSLCFSPEGSQVLTVSGDKTAKIWNVASKEVVSTFEIGKTVDDMLVGCLWQGENIIAVALSGYIYYLNKNDPSTPLRIIKGHNKPVTALSVSEDQSTLYTADQMGRIVLWNAASGENDIIEGKGHSGQVQDMTVSDGNLISVAMDDTIRFTNLSQNQYGDNSTKLDSMPRAVAAESGLVAIACINHIIVFRNGTKLLAQGVNFEPVSVDILKGSSLIAVGGEKDKRVHFYDVSSGGLSEVHVLNNESAAMDVKFSPDGQYVATGGADKYVRCYSVSDYKNLFTYPQHTAKVKCLAWSPDSSRFATGGLDTHLVIWNPTKGTTPQTIKGAHPMSVINKIVWLNDKVLVTAAQDSNVKQWNIE